jgi:chaperonin GroEL (HSP60 family)
MKSFQPLVHVFLQVSLVLRGANDYFLDEVERSLHDALCIVKRTLESNAVCLPSCNNS